MKTANKSKMYTISQVAKILGVSRTLVYVFINSRRNSLPVVYLSERNPRIRQVDLESWIEEQERIENE